MKEMNVSCGSSRIVGCRFTLNVMSDDFVDVILGAIRNVDHSKVWLKTDDISTCIRGRQSHVFDVTRAVFMKAAETGKHVSINGTFSIGCPGDSEGDHYMIMDDQVLNEQLSQNESIQAYCQFAIYPMGVSNYMELIYEGCKPATELGTYVGGIHYASRLEGTVYNVFQSLSDAFETVHKKAPHTIITFNLATNSPSRQLEKKES